MKIYQRLLVVQNRLKRIFPHFDKAESRGCYDVTLTGQLSSLWLTRSLSATLPRGWSSSIHHWIGGHLVIFSAHPPVLYWAPWWTFLLTSNQMSEELSSKIILQNFKTQVFCDTTLGGQGWHWHCPDRQFLQVQPTPPQWLYHSTLRENIWNSTKCQNRLASCMIKFIMLSCVFILFWRGCPIHPDISWKNLLCWSSSGQYCQICISLLCNPHRQWQKHTPMMMIVMTTKRLLHYSPFTIQCSSCCLSRWGSWPSALYWSAKQNSLPPEGWGKSIAIQDA